MKKMKKLAALALGAVLLTTSLAGCGSKPGSDASAGGAAAGSKLNDIIEKGKIVIGVNPPGEPICFYDNAGNLIGYDIDWANKLAETLGVEVEFVETTGEARLSAVTSGRVDLIFANITGSLERAKSINFSIPYLRTGIKMLTAKGSAYKTIAELNTPDARVALAPGTTMEALVLDMAPNATLVYVDSYPDQLLNLKEGKCDAILEDGTSIDYAAGQNTSLEAQPTVYTSDPICVGYAKGDADFARFIDMFVSQMISNGFQAETYQKWFGSEYTGTLTTIW